jgi:dihydropyrimidine dehydrogenase (NAD+) subunit PreT
VSLDAILVAGAAAFLVGGSLLIILRRRFREKRDRAALAEAAEGKRHLAASLHPIVDLDVCIGSLSCIKACPEGDILGIIDGKARLIHGANCIGHGRCADECPVHAIKLVFGTAERGIDLPEVDEFFESSRPGVHVVGELGGMGLIKNAVRQGVQVAERLATAVARGDDGVVDVAIVGAGPAGLATAVGCRAAGLSFRVLEQGRFGGTIANYPRQKVVMTEPVDLPVVGRFGKRTMSKEDLLSAWQRAAARVDLPVEEGVKVTGIDGSDGAFRVRTTAGEVAARKVVLAVGRRGTPRRIGCPGEDLPKVTYSLHDTEQYQGCRVLVVGGGDVALEAAAALAGETDVKVAIAHRGPEFDRAREANKKRVADLVASGRARALMEAKVSAIDEKTVRLGTPGGEVVLPNDYVLVCIGGELPLDFLKNVGVDLRRHHGTAAHRVRPRVDRAEARETVAERQHRRLVFWLAFTGLLVTVGLAAAGWEYYWLSAAERLTSPLRTQFRPSGPWGHTVGVVASVAMLLNFAYGVRKRFRLLKGQAPIHSWMTFHVFVGLLSPVLIGFHAAFQANNPLATATLASLVIVVATGVIGRFLYGLVLSAHGQAIGVADGEAGLERLRGRVREDLQKLDGTEAARALVREIATPRKGSLAGAILRMPAQAVRLRARIRSTRPVFAAEETYRDFRATVLRMAGLRRRIDLHGTIQRLLGGWRVMHTMLAALLVLLMAGHIGVSIYVGYGWNPFKWGAR